MLVKGVIDEDFVNFKLPSMFINTNTCSFKCERESGVRCCQNSALANSPSIDIETWTLVDRYLQNNITKAVVFGGLEPMDQFREVYHFIQILRKSCNDPVVIYTGYKEEEIADLTFMLANAFDNIIVKYGRFVPNQEPHFDEVLGVNLASGNQYAKQIS